ncbi:hypothetical protein ACFW53_02450 [Nocardiopsis dassonvillei]|uniref:hypothetical protein n=1 Tax=Nocardiopsis dassonvillei TaxID=2014 RepID=UPI003670FD55
MRTANPDTYLDDFLKQVQDGLDQYKSVSDALAGAGVKAPLLKAAAEDAAFRLGALWEVFQGRWHVAAISREPQKFVREVKKTLEQKLKDEARDIVLAIYPEALQVPSHPTLAQIESVLDPNRYNLTFKDVEAWMESSALYHSDRYKGIVRVIVSDPESASLLDLLKKLRNQLAHGSHGSKAAFNRSCRARPVGGGEKEGLAGSANDPLKRGNRDVRDVGAYLRAGPDACSGSRVEILHRRVIEVAEKLRAS